MSLEGFPPGSRLCDGKFHSPVDRLGRRSRDGLGALVDGLGRCYKNLYQRRIELEAKESHRKTDPRLMDRDGMPEHANAASRGG